MIESAFQQSTDQGLQVTWCWCSRCQRVYLKGTFAMARVRLSSRPRHLTTLYRCPYIDCGGSATRDSWLWTSVRLQHPEYPEQPERYRIYPR